jgi:hypothetical protein
MFEFGYGESHNRQWVQFTDGGERMLGYSDPDMRNQNREGTRSR